MQIAHDSIVSFLQARSRLSVTLDGFLLWKAVENDWGGVRGSPRFLNELMDWLRRPGMASP